MNKKLQCLYVLADHAIGASCMISAKHLAEFSGFGLNESASYLNLLHKEGSIVRTKRAFIDKAGRNCRRYGYYIDPTADLEQILSKSEEISKKAQFKPKPKQVEQPTGCALAEAWR